MIRDAGARLILQVQTLVSAVVDAIASTPVAAAGGIADGRGLAAALVLGAAGVLVGTGFYASSEALGHAAAKARLVDDGGDATLRTTVFDLVRGRDWPARFTGRALANELSNLWHGHEAELQAHLVEEQRRYAAADEVGDVARAVVWASEAVDLIRDLPPAAEIVERMVREAGAALERGLALRSGAAR
jgi:nitronate monooxygenase